VVRWSFMPNIKIITSRQVYAWKSSDYFRFKPLVAGYKIQMINPWVIHKLIQYFKSVISDKK
jgi:hypothetical protein